jgi:predicted enzyme related to lactoylglutathione lyase
VSDIPLPPVGSINWIDLTVDDADGIRSFYEQVVGWESESVDMGEYSDFNMTCPADGHPVAGVCHARGSNAGTPSQWMVYITVEDVEESCRICEALGGEVVVPPQGIGDEGRICIIRDPAGAVAALFSVT